MSLFEYVTVIISMILALAVGQLLLGAAGLAKNRTRVRGYLPHAVWMLFLFLLVILLWWTQWDLRELTWTFASFVYVLLPPVVLFFAVAILLPDDPGGREHDLEEHFFAVRSIFLSIMFVYGVITWFDGPILQGQAVFGPVGGVVLVYLAGVSWGLMTENRRAHLVIPLVFLMLWSVLMVIRFFPGEGV